MPRKKKKGGAGKAKGKAKGGGKKAAEAAEREELLRICRRFLTVYQQRCAAASSVASPRICRDCREGLENEKPLPKFVLEPALLPMKPPLAASLPPNPPPEASSLSSSATPKEASLVSPTRATPPILLRPLAEAWLEVKYRCMRVLHIWHLQLTDEDIVALALFFESALGVNLKVLELMDTKLSPWAIDRLSRSLRSSQLAVLKLDYNVMLQLQVVRLCACVQELRTLQTLSLSYCQIGPSCGETLGAMAAVATIKELYLAGNALECEGAVELLRPVVSLCELTEQVQPPSLAKLFLQDNAIDSYGTGGMFAPVICMRVFRRWLLSSTLIEEINLDGNLIGDGGARELLEALQGRKEAGHPRITMTVTNRLSPEIFSGIVELGGPAKKKKGRKKGKGKKKK